MFLKLYLISLSILFALDMLWLGFVAKDFYSKQIGILMKTNINWTAGIIFYLLFSVGLVIFVISPAVEKKSLFTAIFMGGLLGFIAYATYDLTNLATLKNWPLTVSIVDMIWGTVLAASVSTITYLVATKTPLLFLENTL